MPNEQFEELLKRIPEIQDAVNGFTSPDVQKAAFETLVQALGIVPYSNSTTEQVDAPKFNPASDKPLVSGTKKKKTISQTTSTSKPNKKKTSKTPTLVKDLNLRPSGKTSLNDFMDDKKPSSNIDKTATSVYYLINKANISSITENHIFTCFKHMGWRIPPNLYNVISKTAQEGYLDTSDRGNLKMAIMGGNFIEHDLPKKSTKKK